MFTVTIFLLCMTFLVHDILLHFPYPAQETLFSHSQGSWEYFPKQ
jgi:hypothetical protein